MTTPAVTPQTPNPLAEFGGVSVNPLDAQATTQPTTPSSPSTTNPLAEFGGIAIPDENETRQPNAYEKATASGPFVPAGAAEKAMGEEEGDNKAQAKAALKQTLAATGETAAGVLGAGPAAAGIESVSAAGAAGKEMLTQLAKEYPTAAKAVKMYTGWLAVHMAHKMGVPLPKVLELIGE
jgi:Tfp pilus assembly protein PilF